MLFDNASTLNLFYLLKKKNLFHRRGKGEFNDILLNDKEDCISSGIHVFQILYAFSALVISEHHAACFSIDTAEHDLFC